MSDPRTEAAKAAIGKIIERHRAEFFHLLTKEQTKRGVDPIDWGSMNPDEIGFGD